MCYHFSKIFATQISRLFRNPECLSSAFWVNRNFAIHVMAGHKALAPAMKPITQLISKGQILTLDKYHQLL